MASPTDIKPPFTLETATAKVRAAENAWNLRDPEKVSMAYSLDSQWGQWESLGGSPWVGVLGGSHKARIGYGKPETPRLMLTLFDG